MRSGGPGRRKGVEGHSWSQLCPFPIWGAADWGQAQGHAAPSFWLGPGAGSECAQDSMCVFLCELREEVQETHLFLIPQKALLSGPGGAGVSVKDCEGRRGRVSGHTHTACVGYDVWCDAAVLVLQPPPPSLPSTSTPLTLTFSECEHILVNVTGYLFSNWDKYAASEVFWIAFRKYNCH